MKYTRFASLIPVLLMAACGGSGDGGNGNNPQPGPQIGIDNGNVLAVAQATYQAAVGAGDLASLASDSGLTGNAGGMFAKPGNGAPGLFDNFMQVPIGPIELPCGVSGTLTIDGDLADPIGGTLAAGDTMSIEYDACDDGVGEVLDGLLEFEIMAITGDVAGGLYDMTAEMTLTNFQSATATDVITGNGDGTATVNTLTAPYVEAAVSGRAMTTDTNTSSQTLTMYSSAQTFDGTVSPSPFTMDTSGTLDSSDLSGSVTYSTPVTFTGFDSNYPTAGELLIVGDGSSARIIAQANGIDVVIEVYSNETGTGTPDSTISTTWTELAGL